MSSEVYGSEKNPDQASFCPQHTGESDVTVICDNIMTSMMWGNSAYCVKLSGEDLSRFSNKIESVGLRKKQKTTMYNNNQDDIYGAIIMTKTIVRVHPVHLMNAD